MESIQDPPLLKQHAGFLVLGTELRVWCDLACELLSYTLACELLSYTPDPLRFGKYSLSEWRHCFLLQQPLTMIHLVNVWCILTWLSGHDGACTDLEYLEVKVGGSEVHRQPGCYIRAVWKGQRTTKKETVYVYMASSAATVSGWWMVLTDFLAMELTGISILTSFCTSHMDWFAFSG